MRKLWITAAAMLISANATAGITDAEDEFGNLRKANANAVDKIYLKIASVTKDPYGALKINFTNGQVWKQTDARHYKLKVDQTVFIEKASLGSFILGSDGRNSSIRVKRLK